MSDTAQARYSTVAIVFHWLIAILVIIAWRIAAGAEHLEGEAWSIAIAPHKAIGITILVLSLLRLVWRLMHTPPALPDQMAGWEKKLVRAVHLIFYVMLIGLPIGGWLAGSYYGVAINYFGIFEIPALPVAEDPAMGEAILDLHHEGGEILLILVALHILGAAKHQFYNKIPVINRIWPGKG